VKFILNNQQVFPVGTTVKAYLRTNWPLPLSQPPEGAPLGAVTAEAVVDASGNLALEGLASETRYEAVAEVGGKWRYVAFRTASPKATAKGLQATTGEGAPGEFALGAFYIQQTAGKNVALWRGKGAGEESELVANLANALITPADFAGAYIDGAVGTPSIRTLLTTLSADNTHAPTSEAVLNAVNAAIQGLSPKPSAALATTEALPLSVYVNGTEGKGATITGTANGALKLDTENGVEVGQHILVKNQVEEAANGLYVVTQTGGVALPFILTRSVEMDQATEFEGAFVFVESGTTNAGSGWTFASKAPGFTVGTTAVKFTQFSGAGEITAGTGLAKAGNTLSIPPEGVTASRIGNLGLGSRFSVDGWGSGSGSFAPTALVEYWLPVKILNPCKLTGITYQVGTVSNGKVIVAVYNAAGERVAVSAGAAQGTAEAIQKVAFEAALTLTEPQILWVSILFESATGTCMGAFNLNPSKKATQAEFKTVTPFVPPTEPVASKAPYLLTY
jgi:hypothetical protein